MGMFDKDRLYGGERLDQRFELGDEFILWGVEVMPDAVPTELGDATKTVLEVSTKDNPEERFKVGTLASAIAEKAKDAEPTDFPAIVRYEKVPGRFDSDAAVISFVALHNADKPPF
jgi:hypothetical protein